MARRRREMTPSEKEQVLRLEMEGRKKIEIAKMLRFDNFIKRFHETGSTKNNPRP